MSTPETNPHPKRNLILISMTLSFVLIAIGCFLYWWIWGRFDEYTDDAYVTGNSVYITPQISGIITNIYTDDTWYVEQGQILIELDKTDYKIALDKSNAKLGQNIRDVAQLFAEANQKKAQIRVAKAQFIKDAEDFERRSALVTSGSVSKEDFSHSTAALTSSYFTLISIEQGYFSLKAQIDNTTLRTHPLVVQAIQEVKENWIQLSRCTIKAPSTGIVAQRRAQVGERVTPAEFILSIVPLNEIWVEANFKEDQIGSMQIGQKATIRTDIYGSHILYEGEVVGIGAGTGSIFSLLPPQNATGNWIKIVQRVPIRISLNPSQVLNYPLRLGLSTEVNVDIHPLTNPPLPRGSTSTPLYTTTIFANEEEGSEALIDAIFANNKPSFSLEFNEDLP